MCFYCSPPSAYRITLNNRNYYVLYCRKRMLFLNILFLNRQIRQCGVGVQNVAGTDKRAINKYNFKILTKRTSKLTNMCVHIVDITLIARVCALGKMFSCFPLYEWKITGF